ncbi:MAG: cytochrome b5 domain-containing protein [Candidatus Berkelbacteria bacterium]
MMKMLIKLDRIAAWVLLITLFLYIISGYGMTKGIIDASWATTIHNNILTYMLLISFVIHTSFAIHLALKRWSFWNIFSKIVLLLVYMTFVIGFVYVDRYYGKGESEEGGQVVSVASDTSTSSTSQISSSSTTRTFTASQLAQYNGKNGVAAYLAVNGTVYDLSSVFKNGYHYGHAAGQDLTNDFFTRHALSAITKYPVVGTCISR